MITAVSIAIEAEISPPSPPSVQCDCRAAPGLRNSSRGNSPDWRGDSRPLGLMLLVRLGAGIRGDKSNFFDMESGG